VTAAGVVARVRGDVVWASEGRSDDTRLRAHAFRDVGSLAELLDDEQRRAELGARGRGFARREMALGTSAAIVAGVLERAISERRG